MNPEAATVGIVIVNYNGRRFLAECLRSLASGTYRNFEIFLVDNNSQDGSADDAERDFPEVHVLRQSQNLGVAAGNNVGIAACRGHGLPYVLLLNYDILPAANMLESLVTSADASTIVSGYTVSWDDPGVSNSHAGGFDWRLGRLREAFLGPALAADAPPQEVEIADTCCLLVHRDVFDRIGTMDAAYFMYYDDTDFVVRARRAGIRVLLNPRARLRHFERGATGTSLSPTSVYYSTRNRPYFMKKHSSSPIDYLAFWSYFILTRIASVLRWLLTGRFAMAKSALHGLGDYLAGRMGPGHRATRAHSSAR